MDSDKNIYYKANTEYMAEKNRLEKEKVNLEPIFKEIDFNAKTGWIKTALTMDQVTELRKLRFKVKHLADDMYEINWMDPCPVRPGPPSITT